MGELGSGNLVTERLDIEGFSEVEVPGSWDVVVRRGEYDVQVTVDDNVIDDLRVERRGAALRFALRPGAGIFRHLTLRAEVSMPALDAATVSGSGTIRFADFQSEELGLRVSGSGAVDGSDCTADNLHVRVSGSGNVELNDCSVRDVEVSISGSGDVTLGGRCDAGDLDLTISGSGNADLGGCIFRSADVRISGSGDAMLELDGGDLNGRISGSGSVHYRGSARRVDVRTSGKGRVIKEG